MIGGSRRPPSQPESAEQAPGNYFCHQCDRYISSDYVNQRDCICRICGGGFVEHVADISAAGRPDALGALTNMIQEGMNNLNNQPQPQGAEAAQAIPNIMSLIMNSFGAALGQHQQQNPNTQQQQPQQGGQPAENPGNRQNQGNRPQGAFVTIGVGHPGGNQQSLADMVGQRRSASVGRLASRVSGGDNANANPNAAPTGDRANQTEGEQNTIGDAIQDFLRVLLPPNAQLHLQINNDAFRVGDMASDADIQNVIDNLFNTTGETRRSRISDEDIGFLPRSAVTEVQVANEAQCSTCMDMFTLNEEVARLECTHIFHRSCLVPWLELHNTCPLCRKVLDPQQWRQADAFFAFGRFNEDDLD